MVPPLPDGLIRSQRKTAVPEPFAQVAEHPMETG